MCVYVRVCVCVCTRIRSRQMPAIYKCVADEVSCDFQEENGLAFLCFVWHVFAVVFPRLRNCICFIFFFFDPLSALSHHPSPPNAAFSHTHTHTHSLSLSLSLSLICSSKSFIFLSHSSHHHPRLSPSHSPVHAAAFSGSLDVVQLLIAAKADCSKQDVFQRTPLHYAAASGVDTVCNIVGQNGECEDV